MSTSRLLAAAAGLVAVVCGAPCHAASGDMVHLGTLPGEPNSVATSINAAGTVLGTSGLRTYVWSRADGMRELTDVDGLIDAADVSDDGAVAGRAWWPGHDWQGFLLTTDRDEPRLPRRDPKCPRGDQQPQYCRGNVRDRRVC